MLTKKELIGDYKNAGSDYRPEGCPDEVNVHDFIDKELGKAIPYGVYDISANAGYVSVGIDHDTAEFAVNSICRWLEMIGQERYPATDRLMNHGRWWRLQWQPRPAVEDQAARACRCNRIDPCGMPLSARHIEMEQDRAPHVLPHHTELAR
jgi:hypothetical protein